jgi:hypothetical protein
VNGISQLALRDAHRQKEFLEKHLARMSGLTVGWNAHHGIASPVPY